jgi:putative membrane protein
MNIFSFFIPWEPSAFSVLIVGAAWCYAKGSGGETLVRKVLFWCGLGSAWLALQTQLDYYAEHAFFMHRLQHLVLHHLSPFLIAASFPGRAVLLGSPLWTRRLMLPAFLDALNNPVAAVFIFDALIAFWLIPSVQLAGMLDWRLYRLMNWGMLLNGLMFWQMVLNPASVHGLGKRIAAMIAICPAQIVMGALLCFSGRDFYPVYDICGRIFPLTPVADQQIGGIILWVPGAMMSIIGIIFVICREMKAAPVASRLALTASSDLP